MGYFAELFVLSDLVPHFVSRDSQASVWRLREGRAGLLV